MAALLVVPALPFFGHATHLAECFEHVVVKHLLAIGSIEAFDKSVLHESTWLDVLQADAVLVSPLLQRLADELRPIVESESGRLTADLDELVQRPHDSQRRQARVDLDGERLAVEVIEHVERAEPAARSQCIRHKVGCPYLIRSNRNDGWHLDACGQPSLAATLQVQLERFVHAIQAALSERRITHRRTELVEAVPRVYFDVALDRADRCAVVLRRPRGVKRRLRQAFRTARLTQRDVVLSVHKDHQLTAHHRRHSPFFFD
jgi:hypothetical protein